MTLHSKLLLPALACFGVAVAGPPALTLANVKVTFYGKGPAGFKIVGTTDKIDVKDGDKQVSFCVPLDSFNTGIELRDAHMKEKSLETKKFPLATLVVDRAALKLPSKDGQTEQGTVTAQLTLHGVTRAREIAYTAQRAGGATRVSASFKLNFNEHGVVVPAYMGITVKPDVEVQASFNVRP